MAAIPNLTVMIYVVVSLVLIAVLVFLLVQCKNREKFCTCTRMNTEVCRDPNLLAKLYAEGIITETTFNKYPDQMDVPIPPYDAFTQGYNSSPGCC